MNGEVGVDLLGRTLMHEHVFTFHHDMFGDYPWVEENAYVQSAIASAERTAAGRSAA